MRAQNARRVLLVGSVPLSSSSTVFKDVAIALGGLVPRIPDGETGVRTNWIAWQEDVARRNPAFAKISEWSLHGHMFGIYDLKAGFHATDVDFGSLGYAEAAKQSYAEFKRLRDAGGIPPDTRFQVSLPTPLPVVTSFFPKQLAFALEPNYERSLTAELDEMCGAIPRADLAIQWDIGSCPCSVRIIEMDRSRGTYRA